MTAVKKEATDEAQRVAKAERDRKCAEKEAKEKAQRVAKKADAFENNVGRPVQVDKWIDDLAMPRRSLIPKGECQNELVMLMKNSWQNGL